MHAIKILNYILSVAGLLLLLASALLLLRRKLQREYPFFLSYLVFQILSTVALASLYYGHLGTKQLYFYVYWVQTALSDLFAFAVLNELFCAAFKPFAGLRDMAQVVFRWAAVALVLVGTTVYFSSSLPHAQVIASIVVNFERSISVMQCGLLLFLFMGSSYLGLSKRSHVFGLTLGFGITAMASLVLVSFLASAPRVSQITGMLPSIASVIVYLTWTFYLASPEPAREAVNVPVTSPLLRWNEVAMALGHSGGRVAFLNNPEPFMPNVERMVEEVMKRDMFVDNRRQ